ncbi:hypothetical protein PP175_02015 [Aneurinibacillus sp. Ricciae_BoGa-3]|uniref:hypothetical protein n=1 Tax=Aneurinibacillus sp. Ricciae_BoGa-3 TaxID=3022697 RepID=UPI00233F94B9|nr:hypothetical protein [Aneurinibacillus sp. Ricciae_BoGa-3]WCK54819.1 hypothetical protein PP175_02015 [Aneurinibacillus sp. Ricciae_BoGa-3]
MATTSAVKIGARCIFKVNGRFFLIAEIEAKTTGVEIEPDVIIRLTNDQAARLLAGGIKRCQISSTKPTASPGTKVEFKCIFIDGNKAFSIFDVENSTRDDAVLVPITVQRAKTLIARGVRRCTVIRSRIQ